MLSKYAKIAQGKEAAVSDNVICLRPGYAPHPQEVRTDENWPRLRDTAIARAFVICHTHFQKIGRKSRVQHGIGSTAERYPFTVLSWEGEGALHQQRIGLHFTYNWVDRIVFNLCAVRVGETHIEQGNYYRKLFLATDPQAPTIIVDLVRKGMENAKLLGELEELPEIEWRKTTFLGRAN